MTVFPSYRSGRRSLSVFLSGGDTGDDIIGGGGNRERPGGGGGDCGCPPGGLQGELWLWRRVCKEIGISSCLTGTGDSLREVGAGGDSAGVPGRGSRCVGAVGAKGMLSPSDGLVALVILLDRSRRAIGTRLLLAAKDESRRTVSEVDVEEVLGVEGVNKALTRSHDGGKEGEEPNPHVRKDKHRPLKCRGVHHPTYRKCESECGFRGTLAAVRSFDLMLRLRVKRQGKPNKSAGGVQLGLTKAMVSSAQT
ncbi:hypothetical protein IEO21_09593 [Rhodonia placenta]|uniref:Uncharacterized protein n=1 Tax=Rhodonia placenta TaxID=104341 RepID=A0A8H7TXR7_9APHY|nr:hypothetical protein IEO21_09593 [Postia placenta]